jgi:Ca2+-transporting ATPase
MTDQYVFLEKSYYDKSEDEIFETLKSSLEGLTNEEAESRLERYGRNELIAKKKKSKLTLFCFFIS